MLESAPLTAGTRSRALAIFAHIAEAEAWVHGMALDEVHFHEVGAVDSIVDIVAAAACLDYLAPSRVTASVVPIGNGFTMSQHGRIPVPAPATLKILEGVPLRDTGLPKELVTPTGAGILRACVDAYGPMPVMTVTRVGHGAGSRKLPDRPNIVRAVLGEPTSSAGTSWGALSSGAMTVLETNVDDMTPELCAHAAQELLDAGARDVWWTPIVMKKGRPAHKLSVLARDDDRDMLAEIIVRETTSLGLRAYAVDRAEVRRDVRPVATQFGPVSVKFGYAGDLLVNVAPEFGSARELAAHIGVPLKRVMAAASAAAWAEAS